jgi:hypothetical protein
VSKLQWESLPADRVAAIEELTGPVVKAESTTGGLMPGLAAVVHATNGRYFVKAAPADSPAAGMYEREITANAALPASVPGPRMEYSSGDGGWLVMVLDYLEGRTRRTLLGRVPDALTRTRRPANGGSSRQAKRCCRVPPARYLPGLLQGTDF